MKKIISLIMCFCILFCSLTFVSINAGALTYGDFEYDTITYGENKGTVRITKYTGSGGNVTIPSEIDGKTVTEIQYAFQNCISLTSVTIPGCIKTIDYNTFSGCVSLKNVTINNGVTVIGDYAFKNCSMLTSISIPRSVTDIKAHAFYGCSKLAKVSLGNGVKSIGNGAFYCENLKSIFLPDSVTNIDNDAFGFSFSRIDITISFSCVATGIKNYCISNNIQYEIIHELSDWIIDSAPDTCDKGQYRVCQKCGYKEYRAISHNMTDWIIDSTSTTCKKGQYRVCLRCGYKEYGATGHNMTDWMIDSASATCDKGKYKVCKRCGYKEYGAVSHNMTAWKTTKKPTYFEAGIESRNCKKCKLVQTKKIAKLKMKTPVITKIKKCNLQGKNGKITFKKVKNASYYEIWDYQFIYYDYVYDDDGNIIGGDGHVSKWKKRKTTKKTSYKLVNLHPGALAKVKIRAVYKKGNKIAYSDFTKAKVF